MLVRVVKTGEGGGELRQKGGLFFFFAFWGRDRDAREFSRCHLVGQRERRKGREGEEEQQSEQSEEERGGEKVFGQLAQVVHRERKVAKNRE